jgi:hypothetical protein
LLVVKSGSTASEAVACGRALLPVIILAACRAHLPAPPQPAASEGERLLQDAEYALEVLGARHPELFHAEARERFEAELEPLRAAPAALERDDVFFALMRLVAHARDAHTRLASWSEIEDLRLPIALEPWTDGLWIAAVGEAAQELFGQRVVTLAGRTPQELAAALRPLVPHENDLLLVFGVAALATLPRALQHVGLIEELAPVSLELEDRAGRRSTVELAPVPAAELGSWLFLAPPGWEAPLSRRSPYEPWWWCPLDGSTLYLQYNQCVVRDPPFGATAAELLARIDQGGVERLLIDLRWNGGGDSRVLRPLLTGLGRRDFRGERVLVAIGAHTFSSGMLNAYQLQRDLGALLVGEPTSQKPDGFGEVRSVVLPNTGWLLDCSTKRFRPFGDDRPHLGRTS